MKCPKGSAGGVGGRRETRSHGAGKYDVFPTGCPVEWNANGRQQTPGDERTLAQSRGLLATLKIPEEIGKAEMMMVVELEVKEKGLLASGSRETRWTGG